MEFTLQPLCCGCCGGPHFNGNCEPYFSCDFCGGSHMNGHCEDFLAIAEEDDENYLEDVLVKFMHMTKTALQSQEQTIKNLEMQIGQLSKQLVENGYCEESVVEIEEHDDEYLEEVLTQCIQMTMTTFQSQEQAIKNLEMQIGQLSKQLAELTRNSNEQVSQFELNKVDKESEYSFVVELEEEVKNKNSGMEEKSQVRCVDIYVKFQTQPLDIEKKTNVQQDFYSSQRGESTQFKGLAVGTWEHLLLYAKFMNFLPQKRKKKDDVFFVSYMPP